MRRLFHDQAKSSGERRGFTNTTLTTVKKGSTPPGLRIGIRRRKGGRR